MEPKLRYLFVALFLSILISSCSDDDTNPQDLDSSAQANYDLYSLILKDRFGDFDYYVISERTSKYEPSPFEEGFYGDREALKALDSSTVENYIAANDSIYSLEKNFSVAPKEVELITKERFDEIFQKDGVINGWETFYTAYPDSKGYIIFGSIGYNDSKTEAIVEVAHVYGSLGADGLMIVLENKNGEWKVRQTVHLWIS